MQTTRPRRKAQCDGQTLHAPISPSETVLVVASEADKPAFTVRPAAYPILIRIGNERLRLNAPPQTPDSPQVFLDVTRGTPALPHPAGAALSIVQPRGDDVTAVTLNKLGII